MEAPEDWMLYTPTGVSTRNCTTSDCNDDWMLYTPPEHAVPPVISRSQPTVSVREGTPISKQSTLPAKARGRKRLSEQFTGIVQSAKSFIQQNDFAAEPRRRSTTARSCGVSLPQLQTHIQSQFKDTGLKNISKSTIRRWMAPPNKTRAASKRYTNEIDAKIPHKRNNMRVSDSNEHYYAARVKNLCEYTQKFKQSCSLYSCDNMNKVRIGVLAVSRYHQIRKIFMTDQSPDYPDHDFPHPGYLITPAGYMQLKHSVERQGMETDSVGRQRWVIPKTGPLSIVNRISSFHPSTIESHMEDMYPVISQNSVSKGQKCVLLTVDGGPDWSTATPANLLFYGRIWRDAKLDLLIVTTYCPGFSAYNAIEHAWSPRSRDLTSVTLPDKLDGDDKAPCQQKLTSQQRQAKEAKVGLTNYIYACGYVCVHV